MQWCDTRARTAAGATEPTPAETARAARCQAAVDAAAGGAAQGLLVAPCNAYKLTARKIETRGLALYDDKLAGLTQTVNRLIVENKVDVIAFQEVRSDETLRAILGTHARRFSTCVAPHTSYQTVGYAWRKAVTSTPGECTPEPTLAIKESTEDPASLRMLRPGLALRLTVAGRPITFMNVHLKSSCANLVPGGGFPGRELTDPEPACRVLNRQVAPLDNWIESVAASSPLFVLLGDFNRRLDEEARRRVPRNKVRLDGTFPDTPNTAGPDGSVSSRFLWQEIPDGKPRLAQVPLSAQGTGCTGFVGLDHILLSDTLRSRQARPPTSEKLPVSKKSRQTIATSDHCPRVTTLTV